MLGMGLWFHKDRSAVYAASPLTIKAFTTCAVRYESCENVFIINMDACVLLLVAARIKQNICLTSNKWCTFSLSAGEMVTDTDEQC